MLAVSKKANRRHNVLALLLCALAIAAMIIFVGCTPSHSERATNAEPEYISFDKHPWDVEFDTEHIYDMNDSLIYFFVDTLYNATTEGITMYSVRKDLALQALDESGSYYITKSCVTKHEGTTLVRKKLE